MTCFIAFADDVYQQISHSKTCANCHLGDTVAPHLAEDKCRKMFLVKKYLVTL